MYEGNGYVASEAYGINSDLVVFGLLYDKQERMFPFRWENGRMTVLKGPNGRIQQADVPDRNTINERGEMTATLLIGGNRRAVRWTPAGKASFLPALPGHTWTNVWSINDDGIVSGWSRKQPNDDGENNPVIWDASGKVIPLKTSPGRADGAAEATNRSGLSVGYLGNLGTDGIPGVKNTDPERDNAVVWKSRAAQPRPVGTARAGPHHRWTGGRQRQGPSGGHVRHLDKHRLLAVGAPDMANGLDNPETDPGPAGLTEKPGRRHQPERHQQPRRHRRQRVWPDRKGLLQAPPHRPCPLDVPIPKLTTPPRRRAVERRQAGFARI